MAGKKILFFTSVISILVLCYANETVRVFVQGFVNVFSSGRSDVRIYIFGFILLFVYSLYLFIPKIKFKNTNFIKWLFIAIFSLHFLTLSGHILFLHSYNLSLWDHPVFITETEITSSYLTHNHFGKSFVGFLLSGLNFEKLDPGIALSVFVAPWFSILFLFCFFILIVLFILFFSIKRLDFKDMPVRFIVAFSIITLINLKTVVDGGVFAEHSVLSLGLLLCLLFKKEKFWECSFGALTLQWIFYFVFYFLGFYDTRSHFLSIALMSAGVWGFVNILLSTYPLKSIRSFSALILTIFVLYFSLSNQYGLYEYRALDANGAIVASYAGWNSSNYLSLGKINNMLLYRYTGVKPVGKVIEENNSLDNIYPVNVPWKTCMPTGRSLEVTFKVLSSNILEDVSIPVLNIFTKTSQVGFVNNHYLSDVRLFVPPCTPRLLSVVQEVLNLSHQEMFIIFDLKGI